MRQASLVRPGKFNKVKDLARVFALAQSNLAACPDEEKRRSVAQSGSLISGVAERYARLAVRTRRAKRMRSPRSRPISAASKRMLEDSDDLRRLIESPVFSADDQFTRDLARSSTRPASPASSAISCASSPRNRRLFAVPGMIAAFRRIAAEARGEVAAEVDLGACARRRAAEANSRPRSRASPARTSRSTLTVDPSLLGGLVVKIGSRQIDTSLKTKLNSLKLALKEVG